MTTPSPPVSSPAEPPMSRRMGPRLVLLLAGLTVLICGSVIVTDYLSTRDRSRPVSTAPSDQPASPRVP